MVDEVYQNKFWIFWKKYGEHITAPLIFIALVILIFQIFAHNDLQNQINENCGWGEDDYQCYCVKSDAMKIKNLMENGVQLNFTYNISGAGIEKAQQEVQDYLDGGHIRKIK